MTALAEKLSELGTIDSAQINETIATVIAWREHEAEIARRSDWRAKISAAEAAGQFERLPIG